MRRAVGIPPLARSGWRSAAAVALACGVLVAGTSPALAEGVDGSSVGAQAGASPAASPGADSVARPAAPRPAVGATGVAVAPQTVGQRAIYMLGSKAPLSARVSAAGEGGGSGDGGAPSGSVEFFDGATSLGSAAVDEAGMAAIETALWPAAGERAITAAFTPAEGTPWEPAASAPQPYRIVDLARIVPDIELGATAAATLSEVRLDWTIANIWFSNFAVGFEREVLGGNVSLPDVGIGPSIAEKQRYYFRPFTFSGGSGSRDTAGNRVIEFSGSARLTSGSANRWDFADPRVHITAGGDGYITAVFSGSYTLAETQEYPAQRLTIATFSGAELVSDAAGVTTADIALNWEGQAGPTGTWARGFTSSFPNEFVAVLNPGISLFFVGSGIATDASKAPHPIRLSFAETPVVDPGGSGGTDGPGGSEVPDGSDGSDGPGAPGRGDPTPDARSGAAGGAPRDVELARSGAAAGERVSAAVTATVALVVGAALLPLGRRLRRDTGRPLRR